MRRPVAADQILGGVGVVGAYPVVPTTASSAALEQRVLGFDRTRLVLIGFTVAMLCSALDAYSFFGVPAPWIGQLAIMSAALVALASGRIVPVPGFSSLILFSFWAVACTAVNVAITDYSLLMPPKATTPYPAFVLLRLVNLMAFGAALYTTYWLLRRRKEAAVTKTVVAIGVGVALAAMYIYLAQLYDLPEPPRNRMGTAGREQITEFNYAFHRAMGTFREPGPLAAWLIVPIMLAFSRRRSALNPSALLMSLVLLLTGSLAGVPGAAIGFLAAVLFCNPLRPGKIKLVLSVVVIIALAALAFSFVIVEDTSPFAVLGERIGRMIDEGMEGSSRRYIYDALGDLPPQILGVGLGHGNLLLARTMRAETVTSYLSLYLGTAYSLGLLGFLLLVWFLSVPIVAGVRQWHRLSRDRLAFWSLAAYFAWLVMFAFRDEELPFMFAVVTALLLHSLRPGDRELGSGRAAAVHDRGLDA